MHVSVAAGFSLRHSGQVSSNSPQAEACGYNKIMVITHLREAL
jgi:hypothetical protein